jgi:hypothetical protein
MASFQDIRNLKMQLNDLWETHFVVYPAEDNRELDKYVERLKRKFPGEQGGELLGRIKQFSTQLFQKAGEESREDLDVIFDAIERSSLSKVRFFKVVHKPRIVMRATPDATAPMVCTRRAGETLSAVEVRDGWIRCEEGARDAWALIDGTALGFGTLLEDVTPASAAATPAKDKKRIPADAYPRQFKVAGKKGALLRKTADLDSARVKPNLDYDTICMVSEDVLLPDGTRRLHVVSPIDGWCSEKVMALA